MTRAEFQALGLAFVAALLAGRARAQACTPSFEGPLVVPDACGSLFGVGDVDGDGLDDFVTAYDDELVTVRALGLGLFAPAVEFSTDVYANAMTLGDWNGDARADVALASFAVSPATIEVFTGNGDGTFVSTASIELPWSTNARLIAGDFDGEGVNDLLAVNSGGYQLSIGAGSGAFKGRTPVSTPVFLHQAVAGDVDGDGDLDLVTGANGVGPRVLANDGWGNFALLPAAPSSCGVFLALADLDGDQVLDLASAVTSGTVYLHLSDGAGGFAAAGSYSSGVLPTSIAVADLDGNGNADVVCADVQQRIGVLHGIGPAAFGPVTISADFAIDASGALADFDGDGRLDLPFLGDGGCCRIARGAGDGSFQSIESIGLPIYVTESEVGDVDGDGRADLVLLDGYGEQLRVARDDGAGGYTLGAALPLPDGSRAFEIADVDGDGRDDALVTFTSSDTFAVYRSTGPGSFAPPSSFASGHEARDILAADLDQDGKLDVALANAQGVGVSYGNGFGDFSSLAQFATTPKSSALAAGDFDGDGWVDLAVTSRVGNDLSLLLGGPQGFHVVPGSTIVALAPQQLESADLDRDGELDLLIADGGLHAIAVLRGDGSGHFAAPQVHLTGNPSYLGEYLGFARFAVADFDADGRDDLAFPRVDDVRVALGEGDGTFTPSAAVHLIAAFVHALDADRDGRLDLVGVGNYTLSLARQTPSSPLSFCSAKTNSLGCVPAIGSSGCPSLSDGAPFFVTATNVLSHKLGVLFYGSARNAAPFHGGTLCIAQPMRRTTTLDSGGAAGANDCSGAFAFDFDAWADSGVDAALGTGDVVVAQYWYRDPTSSFGAGLTDALEFALRP